MDVINSVCTGTLHFLNNIWSTVSLALMDIIDKVNTVVLPCLKDSIDLSVDTVRSLDAHDWTLIGVTTGVVTAAASAIGCACLCKES